MNLSPIRTQSQSQMSLTTCRAENARNHIEEEANNLGASFAYAHQLVIRLVPNIEAAEPKKKSLIHLLSQSKQYCQNPWNFSFDNHPLAGSGSESRNATARSPVATIGIEIIYYSVQHWLAW